MKYQPYTNLDNPQFVAIINNGGTPFSPQIMPFNAPNAAALRQRHRTNLHGRRAVFLLTSIIRQTS